MTEGQLPHPTVGNLNAGKETAEDGVGQHAFRHVGDAEPNANGTKNRIKAVELSRDIDSGKPLMELRFKKVSGGGAFFAQEPRSTLKLLIAHRMARERMIFRSYHDHFIGHPGKGHQVVVGHRTFNQRYVELKGREFRSNP